ncbi:ankyrin repeat domain-containing protein [Occultella glacieicola]|uniref:Ankyrin repeat domain-containing protein n=1 Tax=Occultella glacieicola TaxID=2518684 RepID=A0ABY2E4J1_9MICO|nr:ankyrin repeat domain-containing protein [Occultella glacieicola]TDE94949.1 ankyrin repeat domain-containing protein [Occultella glacieicola]
MITRVVRAASSLGAVALVLAGCGLLPGAGGSGPDVAEHFPDDDDAELARAVAAGDSGAVARLVADGADPDARGADDLTMLQWAILVENADGLAALLDAGADPDLNGSAGKTPLEDTVDVNTSDAASEELVPILLAAGADVNAANSITGVMALGAACVTSSDLAIDLLLGAGADPDGADANGSRPLHDCARVNRGGQLVVLLDAGADPLAETSGGATFQDYYFGYDPELLNDRAAAERAEVIAWLQAHDVPVNPEAHG